MQRYTRNRASRYQIVLSRLIVPVRQITSNTVAWPSGLRRQLQALVRKGAGSNPAAIIFFPNTLDDTKRLCEDGPLYLLSVRLPHGR